LDGNGEKVIAMASQVLLC